MLKIIGFAVVIGSGSVGLDACPPPGRGHSSCSWDARRRRHGRTRPHLNRRCGRDAYVAGNRRQSVPLTRVADVAGVQGMSNVRTLSGVTRRAGARTSG